MGRFAGTTAAHGLVDHVCHAYDGPHELREHAVPFLAAGVSLGQRLVVVAPARDLEAARQLAADASGACDGAPEADVVSFEDVDGTGFVDVPKALDRFRSVLTQAMDDGASGLRALCLVTDAARDPERRRAFAAWEHLAGAWQSTLPIASTCAYDRRVLGDAAVTELACLHPRVVGSAPPAPFRLYSRRGRLVLDGEVDTFAAPLLQRVAAHVRPWPGERLVIDARGLTFVNHRGLQALVEALARPAGGLTLLGTRAAPALLRESLGIGEDLLDVLPWVE
jgi:anti-anti-sigma regulatory factor